MKTNNHVIRPITLGFAVLAIVGLLSLPTPGSAQEPVKGAQRLLQLNANKTATGAQVVRASDTAAMSCAKCKVSRVTIVQPATKTGAKPETNVITRHECPDCKQKVVTEGHGKAATQKLVHNCKQAGNGVAFCCAMK